MKAKFKSNGSIVTGEAAKIFVKIGLAEEIKSDTKDIKIEKPLVDVISQPKAAHKTDIIVHKKRKGRPKKSKK